MWLVWCEKGSRRKDPECHTQCSSPLEELHEQADVEDASEDEEEAVPQADAGVEGREVQVVVVADPSNHCGVQRRVNEKKQPKGTEKRNVAQKQAARCPIDDVRIKNTAAQ